VSKKSALKKNTSQHINIISGGEKTVPGGALCMAVGSAGWKSIHFSSLLGFKDR